MNSAIVFVPMELIVVHRVVSVCLALLIVVSAYLQTSAKVVIQVIILSMDTVAADARLPHTKQHMVIVQIVLKTV